MAYYTVGSRGTDVKKLQDQLRSAGYDPGVSDGIYGPRTQAAVKAYQKANKLTVDGIAGMNTLGALNRPKVPANTTTDPIRDKILSSEPANNGYGQLPGNYQSRFDEDTMSLVDKILNYKPFSYDYASDPSYQAYEKKYTQLGQTAFDDTVGDLSAMTGGRLNTWAASAASQQKNNYMQQLSYIIPTLEQNAYNRYTNEFDMLRDDLATVMDVENDDYSRYRDLIGDYGDQRDYDRGVLETDRDYNRGVLESDRDYDRGVLESNRNYGISASNNALARDKFNYEKDQDKKAQEESKPPTAGQIANYNQILAALKKKQPNDALNYMNSLGEKFYTDLIGENLYNQLLSDVQSGNTPAKVDTSSYQRKIDDMQGAKVKDRTGEEVLRYTDEQIKNYIMNLNLDPTATAELLNYAGISK